MGNNLHFVHKYQPALCIQIHMYFLRWHRNVRVLKCGPSQTADSATMSCYCFLPALLHPHPKQHGFIPQFAELWMGRNADDMQTGQRTAHSNAYNHFQNTRSQILLLTVVMKNQWKCCFILEFCRWHMQTLWQLWKHKETVAKTRTILQCTQRTV